MSDAEVSVPPLPEDGLIARMGISIMTVTPDSATGTMPVEGNTQPYGLLHGGASAVLAETLGSLAAMAHVTAMDPDGIAVGVDLNVTHVRAARSGTVTGTAVAVHLGRSIATYAIEIVDETGAKVAVSRLTCALKTRR
ncbi:hotdog fold thioesterase [Demequina sp. SYSU T00192]|uniref:Hotdog fold thioesterase n=1 Tax=Demequina litoralis TaxID=3051660 RepID=A0ABT8G580_9MICO|nr:hotdog fold thioesterase [Demequina sp. SYSU T00192]MDN4474278.1 hotdog fold thioesterase [Demequina sp. SYSU T00192]